MKLASTLQKIGYFVILGTIVVIPLFFAPVTSEFYEFNKQYLLVLSSLVLLVIWTASFVINRQVRLVRSPLGLPLLALLATWVLSTVLRTPNKFDALIEPGQTATMLGLVLFFFTSVNLIRHKKELEFLIYGLILSTGVLSIVTILFSSGLLPQIIPFNFMKTPLWSPTGNSLATVIFLATLLPLHIVLILKDKSNSTKTLLLSLSLLGSIIAGGLLTYRLFGQGIASRPAFLPQSVSWAIALESLKSSPLLGTGPATYLVNFSRFRPISFNLSPLWNVRFTSASNYYLQIMSTLGILGLLAYVFVIIKSLNLFVQAVKSTSESPFRILALGSGLSLIAAFTLQLFTPVSLVSLFLIFTLILILVQSFKQMGSSMVHEANIDIVAASDSGIHSPILPIVSFGLALTLVVPIVYLGIRGYIAEIYFQNALRSAAANQGKGTYDNLIAAMRTNPYRDSYRVAYSQTNLLLANTAAAKQELTPEDRNTITQLIQQSIREAKNAVSLNPVKVTNVENLANVYRNLVNFAQGADVWTVASYRQAILLDPVNPNLRISLGGVLYATKNYDEAIRFFQQAVDLKPDQANAYYNLAAAYREKGDNRNAFTAMQAVVNLIDKGSADFTKASAELEELRKKLGETSAQPQTPVPAPAQTELVAPKALPSPKITPPIELPSELGPETSGTPAPSPVSATPTPAR